MLNTFFSENRTVYEKKWKNMVQLYRPQKTTKYGAEKMRFACRITTAKNTDTHSQYLIRITVNSSTTYFVAQQR
jgi:hypothetical protein